MGGIGVGKPGKAYRRYSATTTPASSDTPLDHNYGWRDMAFLFIVMNMNRKQFADRDRPARVETVR